MNLLSTWETRRFFRLAAIYYLLFYAIFFFAMKNKVPDLPIVVMQMLGMVMIVFFSLLYERRSISKTLLIIIIFQLVCCFGLRFFNIDYFENPLGYDPQDAMFYHRNGSHIDLPFVIFIRYLESNVDQVDDMGFNIIVYLV